MGQRIRPFSPRHQRTAGSTVFIALLLTASAILAENDKPDVADPLSLERAITLALDAHPELLAREARTHALAWIPAQRASLPDPMLSLNAMSLPTDSFDLNQEPMTQLQFGVSQLIPFPGKRRLARAAAEFDASASGAMLDEVKTRLAERVRLAWWRTFSLDRSLDINTMSQSVTRQLVRSAEARYASGEGSQQDVIVAQLQLSQQKSEAVRLMGMRNSSAAILNSLVQRPVGQPVVLDRSELHRSLPEVPSSSQLQSHAMESRGILRSQRETLRAGAKRLELAAISSRPDIRLGAAYGRRGTDRVREVERPDLLSMTLSFKVPMQGRETRRRLTEQRRNEWAGVEHSMHGTMLAIEAKIQEGISEYETARELVLFHENAIIPQAKQAVQALLARYKEGEAGFATVIRSQLLLNESERHYWVALADAKSALARLAAATGRDEIYE